MDCAPPFLRRTELDFLKKLGLIGKIIIKLLNNKLVKKYRKITYVSVKKFGKI